MEIKVKRINIPPEGVHLMVAVKINGLEANLVVDTGASRSVIDYEFLTSLLPSISLQEEQGQSAGVGASDLTSFVAIVEEFVIGDLVLHDLELASLDLSHVKQSYHDIGEEPIYGVLGGDVLSKYNAIIDYSKNTLWLKD